MNIIEEYVEKYGYKAGKKYPWSAKTKSDFISWVGEVFNYYDIKDWFDIPRLQIKGYYLKALLHSPISLDDEEFFLPLKDLKGEIEYATVCLLYSIVKKGSRYGTLSAENWKENLCTRLMTIQFRAKEIQHIYVFLKGDVNYLHTKEEKKLLKYYFAAVLKYYKKSGSLIRDSSIYQMKKEMENLINEVKIKENMEYLEAFSRIKEIAEKGISRPNEYYKENYDSNVTIDADCKKLEASGNSDALVFTDVVRNILSRNSQKHFYAVVNSVNKINEMLQGKSFDDLSAIDVFHEIPFVGVLYDSIVDYCSKNNFNKVCKYLSIKVRPIITGRTVNMNNETGDWMISGVLVPQNIKETAYIQVLKKYNLEKVPVLLYKDEVLRIMKERGDS